MAVTNINGNLSAQADTKLAIVVGRFNSFINERLLEGAIDCFVRHGGNEDNITVIRVPGAFEIPLACQRLVKAKSYDGIVALGSVIRGSTPHFDFVANEASKGIAQISLQSGVPIGFGVLTTDNIEQAIERAGTKAGNKGADCMLSVIEMIDLFHKI
ncbi:MAG: 6,7-dimethyl-8-ribityllumazine synthase [bacterium]|jgi:6,7-dimethyl-8-ribityllumazine synthase